MREIVDLRVSSRLIVGCLAALVAVAALAFLVGPVRARAIVSLPMAIAIGAALLWIAVLARVRDASLDEVPPREARPTSPSGDPRGDRSEGSDR